MAAPIYRELQQAAAALLKGSPNGNAGLVHERFADSWKPAWGEHDAGQRREFLRRVAGLAGSKPQQQLLDTLQSRRSALCAAQGGAEWRAATLWRMVAGMGRANPLEIGFCWDPLLGVPRLPGSSIKGAVRSWVETVQAGEESDVFRIFGPRSTPGDPPEKRRSGTVVFLGAHPVEAAALDLDVMTVHHKRYYDSKGAAAPDGMESPNPLLFLAVRAGVEWVFRALPRTLAEQARADAQRALGWLESCAGEFGLGAKTAAGYGYFGREQAPGSAPPAAGGPLAQREAGTWEGALLQYVPNTGAVEAVAAGKKATASAGERDRLLAGLTEEQRARLTQKGGPRKLTGATVRVERLGNAWKLVEIVSVEG